MAYRTLSTSHLCEPDSVTLAACHCQRVMLHSAASLVHRLLARDSLILLTVHLYLSVKQHWKAPAGFNTDKGGSGYGVVTYDDHKHCAMMDVAVLWPVMDPQPLHPQALDLVDDSWQLRRQVEPK